MKNKLWMIISLGVIFALVLVACQPAATVEAPAEEASVEEVAEEKTEPYKIGFIMKIVNPYFQVMQQGAEAKAEELGVNLLVEAALEHTDIEGQIAIIEDFISQEVDAIVIAASGSKEVVPALAKAIEAGIVVVSVDNRLDATTVEQAGLEPIPYVGVDDADSAYMAAKAVVDELQGVGKVAIIEGIRGVDNAEKRKSGAEKAFSEASGIEVVAEQTANWDAEEALDVVTNILTANPDLNGIFCANDQMAFGAAQAVQNIGKTGEIFVVGIDAEEQAFEAIKAG